MVALLATAAARQTVCLMYMSAEIDVEKMVSPGTSISVLRRVYLVVEHIFRALPHVGAIARFRFWLGAVQVKLFVWHFVQNVQIRERLA